MLISFTADRIMWLKSGHALGQQVQIAAGSRLIAHFHQDLDAEELRVFAEGILMDALTSLSGVRMEVARGCTIVYICFVTNKEASQAGVMKLLIKLSDKGATLTWFPGFGSQSGILKLQGTGVQYIPVLHHQVFDFVMCI